jgi:hypothetical protein
MGTGGGDLIIYMAKGGVAVSAPPIMQETGPAGMP